MLQARLSRRIAALKVSWKLADGHCPAKSECTTAENARPVTPGYNILELLAAGVIIVMAGDGETQQITDGYGRTFFLYEESKLAPVTLKGINWDPKTQIPNMMEIPRFGAKHGVAPGPGTLTFGKDDELYYRRPAPPPSGVVGGNASGEGGFSAAIPPTRGSAAMKTLSAPVKDMLHYQILGKANGAMRWMAIWPRGSASVAATTEAGVLDSIHLGGPGGHFQTVTVQFPYATKAREVSLTLAGWRGEDRTQTRSFMIEKLSLDRTDSIRAQLSDGGKQLILENTGAAKTFDLRMLAGLSAKEVDVRSSLTLDAGSLTRITPSDWGPRRRLLCSFSMPAEARY